MTGSVASLGQALSAQASPKAVFTDIFDTLVVRSVHPENVKRLAAARLCLMLGLDASPEAVYQHRNRLERDLCLANEHRGYDLEFHFDDFTSRLYTALVAEGVVDTTRVPLSDFVACCEEAEIETEARVQSLDEAVITELTAAKAAGATIVAVSDFYLPRRMIERLFAHHGILGLFDAIFVSCEPLLTKRSGRLYDHVLAELNLPPSEILMIGDNEHSDYRVSKEKGLNAYLIDRAAQRKFYERAMHQLMDRSTLSSQIRQLLQRPPQTKVGPAAHFTELAFTLYGFIEKLHQQLLRDGVRNVFFLSREGEFLKKLFDRYQALHRFGSRTRISSHYLLVSRKSTYIASVQPLADEDFQILFRQYRKISLAEFLGSLNFPDEDIAALAQELAVEASEREEDFPSSPLFERLRALNSFKARYDQIRSEQRALLQRYVSSFNVNLAEEGLSLVDVGWKGTIQDNIHHAFDERLMVRGYYVGLIAPGRLSSTNQKVGLLFTSLPSESRYFPVFNENRPLYEILLGASHGSAHRYRDRDGEVLVETQRLDQEQEIFETVIRPIQNQLAESFNDLARLFARTHLDIRDFEAELAQAHARMTLQPREEELAFFTKLHHYENFGVFETSRFHIGEKVPLTARIRNLLALMRAPRRILFSGWWTPLTLEQLGLGFLRPAYGRYRYNRIFNRNAK